MTTRTFARSVLATLGLCFAFASSGYAEDRLYHGSLCNPASGLQAGQAFYTQFGVTTLTSALLVTCGGAVVFSGISDIEEVDVTVYDRHASEDVVCTLMTVTLDGTATTTATQRSFGSSPFHQMLVFRPVRDTPLTTIHLQCVIPPVGAMGLSHVTTYRVISTP